MAGTQIRIDPQQVRGTARTVSQVRETTMGGIQQLNQAMETLRSQWEGATQARFYEQYEQVKQSMTQFTDWLEHIGRDLENTAQTFEEVEQRLAAQVSSGIAGGPDNSKRVR